MAAWCNVRYKWLSLHAGVAIKGEDRDGLKRLFRYAARSSVAVSQLSYVTAEDPDRSHPERSEGPPRISISRVEVLPFGQDDVFHAKSLCGKACVSRAAAMV